MKRIANNQLEKFRLIFSRCTNRDVAPLSLLCKRDETLKEKAARQSNGYWFRQTKHTIQLDETLNLYQNVPGFKLFFFFKKKQPENQMFIANMRLVLVE